MKTKDIHSVFGVPPATLFDWSKAEHKKHKLAELLKSLSMEEVECFLNKHTKLSKPMMLLSTVNCSIGDKSKHFTLTSLKHIFYKKEALTIYEKYALKTINNEALESEISDFVSYYHIPDSRVKKTLTHD